MRAAGVETDPQNPGGVPRPRENGRIRAWGLLPALLTAALVAAAPAGADLQDEIELAERYAPVVRLVEQAEECGPGEPYEPLNVDLLFDEPTVALRGPWGGGDLVEIGPTADDLAGGLYEYHLDFPGNALDPGCTYELWARRLSEGEAPAVYAHVVGDPGHPGELALQYWLFYAYNDWNNLHEGDWEMIQLLFDAEDAAAALDVEPTRIGYSQHEGAEEAEWGEDKLELVDGTHPVVHPAAGSHANFFEEGLFLGSSAEQGVGCDDTSGPTVDLRPTVITIPGDQDDAQEAYPWIDYQGRWGELQPAFFNGPTGPNLKTQWTEPVTWSEGWRDQSYAVPAGGALGTGATDFFCDAIAGGSKALQRGLENPPLLFGVLALLILGVISAPYPGDVETVGASAPGTPSRLGADPPHVAEDVPEAAGSLPRNRARDAADLDRRRRSPGDHPPSLGLCGDRRRRRERKRARSPGVGPRDDADAGRRRPRPGCDCQSPRRARRERPVGPIDAYRLAVDSVRPLLGALAVAVVVISVLATTVFLIPVAIWLAVRWALIAPVAELEDVRALEGLRRSARLVRLNWLKVATLAIVGGALALAVGPLVGAVLILLTSAPLGARQRRRRARLRRGHAACRPRYRIRLLRCTGARRAGHRSRAGCAAGRDRAR